MDRLTYKIQSMCITHVKSIHFTNPLCFKNQCQYSRHQWSCRTGAIKCISAQTKCGGGTLINGRGEILAITLDPCSTVHTSLPLEGIDKDCPQMPLPSCPSMAHHSMQVLQWMMQLRWEWCRCCSHSHQQHKSQNNLHHCQLPKHR